MQNYKDYNKDDLKQAFSITSQEMNVSEVIIEKDFWVCFILELFFSIEELKDNLTFKGGTSLSKIFNKIVRFSEDVDMSIERKFFGCEGVKEPLNVSSNKKAKQLLEELTIKCQEYIKNLLLPLLNEELSNYLSGENWKVELDIDDKDQQTILFYYPSLLDNKNDYVRNYIKIEIGARADHWPVITAFITSFVEKKFPTLIKSNKTLIKVLNVERTFWEKATILHKYAHFPKDKIIPIRQSRHYYDFYCLLISEVKEKALNNLDLLDKVILHNSTYFRSGWANYNTARKGTFKDIPDKRVLDAMEKDYLAMKEMFFDKIPSWDEIIKTLKSFEEEFNKIC